MSDNLAMKVYISLGQDHLPTTPMTQTFTHPKLAHLSQQQIEELLRSYYANEKIRKLLTRYNIDFSVSRFHQLLPPIILNLQECPACGAPMIQPRVARGQEQWGKPHIRCSQCPHEDIAQCSCSYCEEVYLAEEEARIESKRAQVEQFAQQRDVAELPTISTDDLSLREAVSLVALVRTCGFSDVNGATSKDTLEPMQEATTPFAPEAGLEHALIKELMDRKLISPSASSDLTAFGFDEDSLQSDYTQKVRWKVMCADVGQTLKGLEDTALKGTWPERWHGEVKDLWSELSHSECKQFYLHAAAERQLPITDGVSLDGMLNNIVRDFSVAQCYNLITWGAKSAIDFRVREQRSARHAANYMIGACQRRADRARAETWKIFPYHRESKLPRSMVSHVLHDVFLKIGERGFTEPPSDIRPEPNASASDDQPV